MRAVAAALAALWLMLHLAPPAAAQSWQDTHEEGDYNDHDWACSQGPKPRRDFCNPAHLGQVAVCWTHRATGACGGAAAWCAYKWLDAETPRSGSDSPGEIYVCRRR